MAQVVAYKSCVTARIVIGSRVDCDLPFRSNSSPYLMDLCTGNQSVLRERHFQRTPKTVYKLNKFAIAKDSPVYLGYGLKIFAPVCMTHCLKIQDPDFKYQSTYEGLKHLPRKDNALT